jgi:hypothetical protein
MTDLLTPERRAALRRFLASTTHGLEHGTCLALLDALEASEARLTDAREERDCAAGWAEVNDQLRRDLAERDATIMELEKLAQDVADVLKRHGADWDSWVVEARVERAIVERDARIADLEARLAELGADGPDHLTPTERRLVEAALRKADGAAAREADLRARLADETAIVDRVWKALGIENYEQAKPLAIDEHVTALRTRLHNIEVAYMRNRAWGLEQERQLSVALERLAASEEALGAAQATLARVEVQRDNLCELERMYRRVIAGHGRIAREMDAAINGDGGAEAPALIDVQCSVEAMIRDLVQTRAERDAARAEVERLKEQHRD